MVAVYEIGVKVDVRVSAGLNGGPGCGGLVRERRKSEFGEDGSGGEVDFGMSGGKVEAGLVADFEDVRVSGRTRGGVFAGHGESKGLLYVRIKVRRFCSSGDDERTDDRAGNQRKDYGGKSPKFISEIRKRGYHLSAPRKRQGRS